MRLGDVSVVWQGEKCASGVRHDRADVDDAREVQKPELRVYALAVCVWPCAPRDRVVRPVSRVHAVQKFSA